MDLGLGGRTALVMAATRGLGRAVAEGLAAEGCDVAICARDHDAALQAAAEIATRHGVRAYGEGVDVSDAAALQAFVEEVGRRFDGIDVLVTNAGGPPSKPFVELDDATWREATELTLWSVVRAVQAALPHMGGLDGREGFAPSITAIVSSTAKSPKPNMVLSNSLRPAIVGLMRTLAIELAERGVRANCVAPGKIDTERVQHLDGLRAERGGVPPDAIREASERVIPAGRYGEPSEFADAVVWLASARARYVTGQTVFVDGGMTQALF
jgi:3-oxoacyl-[acyl-carrier protein] reductase